MTPSALKQLSLQSDPALTAAYASLAHDFNPLHLDESFASQTPFGGPIVHGSMSLVLLLNAIEATFGAATSPQDLDIRFTAPVRVGQRITAGGERTEDGFSVWVRTDDGREVLSGSLRIATPE